MNFRAPRSLSLVFFLLLMAAALPSDVPALRKNPDGTYTATQIPVGDLVADYRTAETLNGTFKLVENHTKQGDHALTLRSVQDPKRTFTVSPEYLSSPPIADQSKPSPASQSNGGVLACLKVDDQPIPELPSSGAPPNYGTLPLARAPVSWNPGRIAEASDLADRERWVENTRSVVQSYQDRADQDLRTLNDAFRRVPEADRREAFRRSASALERQIATLDQSQHSTMLPGERLRFRNFLANAMDKANAAASGKSDAIPSLSEKGVALGQGLSHDGLTDRMVLLQALPRSEQSKASAQLKFLENVQLKLPSGKNTSFPIPHNGYWLGDSKTGIDCSGLVSSLLPADLRKLRLTTLDLRTIYELIRTGSHQPPPHYQPDRLKMLQALSKKLEVVQIHLGESLKPFDLLVYRLPKEPTGHVFVVEKFDATSLNAQVSEASQSYGGLRSRPFNLSLDPPESLRRVIRPGLFALRIKSQHLVGTPSAGKKGNSS